MPTPSKELKGMRLTKKENDFLKKFWDCGVVIKWDAKEMVSFKRIPKSNLENKP